MKYYVKYRVEGFGERQSGPYEEREAQMQLEDIRGYEGVFQAYLAPATEEVPSADSV